MGSLAPSPLFFNLSRCLAGSSLRIAGPQRIGAARTRSGHSPVAAPLPSRAVSRHAIKASPSKGLVR
jgi:hypothetical protein